MPCHSFVRPLHLASGGQHLYAERRDDKQQLWASVLFGLPGFICADDPSKLEVRSAGRILDDPVSLDPGKLLGTYCIDLQTRKRFRQNGRIASHDNKRLCMDVRVNFSSCPKFIQGEVTKWKSQWEMMSEDYVTCTLSGARDMKSFEHS